MVFSCPIRETATYMEPEKVAKYLAKLNIPHISVVDNDYVRCNICNTVVNRLAEEDVFEYMQRWKIIWWPSIEYDTMEYLEEWSELHRHLSF